MKRAHNKVALITGAARGQGRSHALRLAEEGADIIAVDICAPLEGMAYAGASLEELHETASQVEAMGRRIIVSTADVRNFGSLSEVVGRAVEEFGRLDIVAANAGIGSLAHLTHEIPAEVWQQMLDVNLTGVWHTIKACVPHMIAGERGGTIVITSSAAGLKAYPGIGHYVAGKHAIVGLMKTAALELGSHGIRVNSVHPTQVDTPMIMNEGTYRLFVPQADKPTREDFAAVSAEMHALNVPWVEPIDISNALVWLCSDEARYVTGVALPIDAGVLIK
jgi:SDR family mycofactocin-dependent oxidoreductase